MARYYGMVGYVQTEENPPESGIWEETTVERPYYGDIIRNTANIKTEDQLNDNISINNQISILSDPYANENFHAIRYITFMNSKWKVTSVEVKYPRLIFSIGGVYNG